MEEDFIFDNDNEDNVNSDHSDDEEAFISAYQEESIFFSEDTNLKSLVINSNEIEEGNTSFDFEQGETLDVDTESSVTSRICEFSINSMPIYICFVTIFIVIFHLIFLVDNDRYILIEFCNNLLSICNLAGSLCLTINSLRHITGFDKATKGMTVYVTCSKCHLIYPPGTTIKNCNFKIFPESNTCNNPLYKFTIASHSSPVMMYPYNSLKHTLQQHFSKSDFEQRINLWRNHPTMENTKLDIYDSAI
ncbi:hypothetical protein PHYBLDRAFT_138421 [Phycomyces blakesleeanus NRRL 1555(-)]|uniref:Uncharacterized protein n=1 Tax=Phycomyces blakesleeanus (strain ATCC 8743b / DSM 1359 / FGSC 10004 / NBRC 33097 / NRRL 1555) TaxID=763407 RepID=A0A167R551_PHYB8|nr:hypothetical protein PHYBLDRAFT_138421 [Phycomyces blakesleeanus NRRL 1555(-)]OAD80868.1 hypothetical protein PHYBLDRAFT_138421 [Phycomyces blakesleeanus NRRL 1555(-)]|eukprot:XP_018298908.1 hypothetical protein PHYBLDRAFT_138421 [Phycomyces blakesleeanus NRRL 1555(-)]